MLYGASEKWHYKQSEGRGKRERGGAGLPPLLCPRYAVRYMGTCGVPRVSIL